MKSILAENMEDFKQLAEMLAQDPDRAPPKRCVDVCLVPDRFMFSPSFFCCARVQQVDGEVTGDLPFTDPSPC